jgi:programmed cell death 8 (apoptosis-inducing factor)
MFRINHLLQLRNVTVKILTRSPVATSRCSGLQRIQSSQLIRFYSKDKDDVDKKRLPHIDPDQCPVKPTLESECPQAKEEPQPECPYDESSKWDNYKNAALLGLLITAATLGALYALGFFDSEEKKQKVAEIIALKKKKLKRQAIKDPRTSKEIPNRVPYLLIGGGTASFAAFRAIKSADPTAKVIPILILF